MYFKGDYMLLKMRVEISFCHYAQPHIFICWFVTNEPLNYYSLEKCWRIWQLMLYFYCCFFSCIVSIINRMSLPSCLVVLLQYQMPLSCQQSDGPERGKNMSGQPWRRRPLGPWWKRSRSERRSRGKKMRLLNCDKNRWAECFCIFYCIVVAI